MLASHLLCESDKSPAFLIFYENCSQLNLYVYIYIYIKTVKKEKRKKKTLANAVRLQKKMSEHLIGNDPEVYILYEDKILLNPEKNMS